MLLSVVAVVDFVVAVAVAAVAVAVAAVAVDAVGDANIAAALIAVHTKLSSARLLLPTLLMLLNATRCLLLDCNINGQ